MSFEISHDKGLELAKGVSKIVDMTAKDKQALIRVARAAKTVAAQVEMAREPNKPLGKSPILTKVLLEALKEVGHLL